MITTQKAKRFNFTKRGHEDSVPKAIDYIKTQCNSVANYLSLRLFHF